MPGFPQQKPLQRLKADVRKLVKKNLLGDKIESLDPTRRGSIQHEIVVLRDHYRDLRSGPGDGGWNYGESEDQLIAYALAYYPYYVEVVPEAIAKISFQTERHWNLASSHKDIGQEETKYAIVGCGSAPELYGLLRYIRHLAFVAGDERPVNTCIKLFEPNRQCWEPLATAITKPLIKRSVWLKEAMDEKVVRIFWSLETRIPDLELPSEFDVTIAQHVLNEVRSEDRANWLSKAMISLVPGGLFLVVDVKPDVHEELQGMGFALVNVGLCWSEKGERRLDRVVTNLFRDLPREFERKMVEVKVSFYEKPAVPKTQRRR